MAAVSIVLPTYNGERYIEESVGSIIGQSFRDWELIIVDDGSTDKTAELARRFEKTDPRIRVIRNETNRKLPASLNRGFAASGGQYLTWTSDDNLYMPTAIEEMVCFMQRHREYPMVCADMKIIDENGGFVRDSPPYSEGEMYYNDCAGACFMYRREILDTVGGYNEDMFCVEDYEYWLRILKEYGAIGHLEKTLYYYREHGNSLTATKRKEVKRKLLSLRIRELDWLLSKVTSKAALYCSMYYDYCFADGVPTGEETAKLRSAIPETRIDCSGEGIGTKPYIIWGAGDYGRRARAALGDKAAFFADRSPQLAGTIVEGLRVLSLDEMCEKSGEYEIVIAIRTEDVYWLLRYAISRGIGRCKVFQRLLNKTQ